MTAMRYLRGHVVRADGDGPIRFVAATEGKKADGIDLRMDRLSLDRFRANPVILYGHTYWGRDSLPIGRSVGEEIDDDRLLIDVEFDRDDQFAAQVERKYRQRFLNAVSVGFDIRGLDQDGVPDSWELLELSAVPVPLDPEALAESGRAAVRSLHSELGEVLRRAGEKFDAPEPSEDDPEDPAAAFRTQLLDVLGVAAQRCEECDRRRAAGERDDPEPPAGQLCGEHASEERRERERAACPRCQAAEGAEDTPPRPGRAAGDAGPRLAHARRRLRVRSRVV